MCEFDNFATPVNCFAFFNEQIKLYRSWKSHVNHQQIIAYRTKKTHLFQNTKNTIFPKVRLPKSCFSHSRKKITYNPFHAVSAHPTLIHRNDTSAKVFCSRHVKMEQFPHTWFNSNFCAAQTCHAANANTNACVGVCKLATDVSTVTGTTIIN